MTTQLPTALIPCNGFQKDLNMYTPLEYLMKWKLRDRGRRYVAEILAYIYRNGPQSRTDLWDALGVTKQYKEISLREAENIEEETGKRILVCKPTLDRHLSQMNELDILHKGKDRKHSIYDGPPIYITVNPRKGKDKFQYDLNEYKKSIRKQLRDKELVFGAGSTSLFYHKKLRDDIENNIKILIALRIIDEGNQILHSAIQGNDVYDEYRQYLVTSTPRIDQTSALNMFTDFELMMKTNNLMVPIIDAIYNVSDTINK